MKGDFSRLTWDRRRHYRAVLMQQGRLQLDADWNEQVALILHRLETETADRVGHSGVPMREPDGFRIGLADRADGGQDLTVQPGRLYVDGWLLENEDVQRVPAGSVTADLPPLPARAVVYLEAWQRHVTALDDPHLRDVALGGPDTATRLQSVWRLRALWTAPDTPPTAIADAWADPVDRRPTTGLLNARVVADLPDLDNRLYRVEIHSVADDGTVRLTWSRDNACRAASVVAVQAGSRGLQLATPPHPADLPEARSWAEVLTAEQESFGERGSLVQLEQVDGTQVTITAESWPWPDPGAVPDLRVLRPWDGPTGFTTVPPVAADGQAGQGGGVGWTALERGIEIRLEQPAAGNAQFVPGDYWIFASRAATSGIEWPTDAGRPLARPCAGVERHYTALAVLDLDASGRWSLADDGDLRRPITPLDQGFVRRGPTGDVMRGPLTIAPLLTATADGETLSALRVEPQFADDGHQGVTHQAVVVHGGLSVGTADLPGEASVFGPLSVRGLLAADQVRTPALTAGRLALSGTDAAPDPANESFTLQLGAADSGIAFVAEPPALLFGDGTKDLTFAITPRGGQAGVPWFGRPVMTFTGDGRIGIGTPSPVSGLHIDTRPLSTTGPGGHHLSLSAVLDETEATMQAKVLSPDFPDDTLLLGGINKNDPGAVLLYWKHGRGGFRLALRATDTFFAPVRG